MKPFEQSIDYFGRKIRCSITPLPETYLVRVNCAYIGNLYKSESGEWKSTWSAAPELIEIMGALIDEQLKK